MLSFFISKDFSLDFNMQNNSSFDQSNDKEKQTFDYKIKKEDTAEISIQDDTYEDDTNYM